MPRRKRKAQGDDCDRCVAPGVLCGNLPPPKQIRLLSPRGSRSGSASAFRRDAEGDETGPTIFQVVLGPTIFQVGAGPTILPVGTGPTIFPVGTGPSDGAEHQPGRGDA